MTPPRPSAFRLAEFDPVIKRACEAWVAAGEPDDAQQSEEQDDEPTAD